VKAEQINFSRLKCHCLKRLMKRLVNRARRQAFTRFLLTGIEPDRRETRHAGGSTNESLRVHTS
jgi:hypothetical protein